MFDIRCKGCFHDYNLCLLRYIETLVAKCPCRTCLIKVMCKVLCSNRSQLYKNLPNEVKGLILKIHHKHPITISDLAATEDVL